MSLNRPFPGGGGGATPSDPTLPGRPQARRSSLHTTRHITQGGQGLATYTVQNVYALEGPFDAVRLAYAAMASIETQVQGVTLVMAAPSSALGDGITPVNAAGAADNTLWVPITFDRGGRGGPPDAAVSAGTRRGFGGMPSRTTLVGTTCIDRPVLSDLVPLKSLAPTDGAYPYLFVRTYSATRLPVLGAGATAMLANWNGYGAGRLLKSFSKFGDGVTTPSGFASGSAEGSYVCPWAVQVQYRRRGLSVASIGDSTIAGDGMVSGSAGDHASPLGLACLSLSTPDVPVSHANFAVSGSRSSAWAQQAAIYLDTFRPDVLEIPAHTPNDTPLTQASVDAGLALAEMLAELAVQRGAIPIITMPLPWNWTGTTLTIMLDLVARMKAMKGIYPFLADRYSAVVDAAGTGGTSLPAYLTGDVPYHLNLAGNQAVATQVYVPILQRILSGGPTP